MLWHWAARVSVSRRPIRFFSHPSPSRLASLLVKQICPQLATPSFGAEAD